MPDLLTVQQLAAYLQISKRTIYRLVDQDRIPAVRVGGQWRFPKSSVDYWLDLRLGTLAESDLDALHADSPGPPVTLASALARANALLSLTPSPGVDVVRQLVSLVQFPEDVDRELVISRVREREALCSTAMPGGTAILHTARWQARVLRDHDLLAIGRLSEPIDFGALDGGRTDVLALILARNERNHLVLLTKLTRLSQEKAFVASLRVARSASDVRMLVADFEHLVFHPSAGRV